MMPVPCNYCGRSFQRCICLSLQESTNNKWCVSCPHCFKGLCFHKQLPEYRVLECYCCNQKYMIRNNMAYQLQGELNSSIVCPHCDFTNEKVIIDNNAKYECINCEKKFKPMKQYNYSYTCPYCYQTTGTDIKLQDNDTLQCFSCKNFFTFYLGTTQVMNSCLDIQEGGDHYKSMAVEPAEYIAKNKIGFLAGNAIKYLSRYDKKDGAEDIRKARHYCEMILEFEYDIKVNDSRHFDTHVRVVEELKTEIAKRDEVIIGLQQVNRELVEAAKEDHKKITEMEEKFCKDYNEMGHAKDIEIRRLQKRITELEASENF